jgi:protein-export SecD/SecF family membrane protein
LRRASKTNKLWVLIVVVVALALSAGYGYYSLFETGPEDDHGYSSGKLNLGLDLRGGVYVLLEARDVGDSQDAQDALQRAITIIRNRVDEFGVAEPEIRQEGDNRILIELPGIDDHARAMEIIGRTAQLNFVGPDGEVILTGTELKNAYVSRDELGRPAVSLEFDPEGSKKFAAATEKFLRQPIAILLDDEVVSAPTVVAIITDGNAQITGRYSVEEAADLALILRSGALPVELVELETRSVGPTLGQDSWNRGLKAGMLGMGLVMLFMLGYYRFLGAVADFTLFLYIILVLEVLSWFNATLTLPGVAGLILSIGMAVDANVIIFERIKEEMRAGRTVRTAVEAGFQRAFRTILDANITTLIAAGVLFYFGTGAIRGFAVTLTIGILVSMFTAIVLTRFLLRLILQAKLIHKPWHMGVKN